MRHNGFIVDIHRTDVVTVDELAHKLPPSRGLFDSFQVADYHCPKEWSKDGFFISVKEGEPMWFDFRDNFDECACLPAVQRLNPITGDPSNLDAGLTKDPAQNYMYLPDQLWLDGYAKDGKVYQFVVTKEGIGLAVNEFVLPKHMQDSHAIAFVFYRAKHPKARAPKVTFIPTPVWHSPAWKTRVRSIRYGSAGFASLAISSPNASSKGIFYNETDASCRSDDSTDPEMNCIDSDAVNISSNILAVSPGLVTNGGLPDVEVPDVEVVDILKEAKDVTIDKASMGMGGRIKQKIVIDPNSIDYYSEQPDAVFTIYMTLPAQFKVIMEKGKRQDHKKKDKFVNSGEVGGVQVPLMKQD